MKSPAWDPAELKLITDRIAQGFISEVTLREVQDVLAKMVACIQDQFLHANPAYYQKIDNDALFVLHLKGRILKELLETLTVRVDMGRTAQEQKTEFEKQGAKFNG